MQAHDDLINKYNSNNISHGPSYISAFQPIRQDNTDDGLQYISSGKNNQNASPSRNIYNHNALNFQDVNIPTMIYTPSNPNIVEDRLELNSMSSRESQYTNNVKLKTNIPLENSKIQVQSELTSNKNIIQNSKYNGDKDAYLRHLEEDNKKLRQMLDSKSQELSNLISKTHNQIENMISKHSNELTKAREETREYYMVGKNDGISELKDRVKMDNIKEMASISNKATEAALVIFEERLNESLKQKEKELRIEFDSRLSDFQRQITHSIHEDQLKSVPQILDILKENNEFDKNLSNIPLVGKIAIPDYVFDFTKRRLTSNIIDTMKSKLSPVPRFTAFELEDDLKINNKEEIVNKSNIDTSKYVTSFDSIYRLLVQQHVCIESLILENNNLKKDIEKYALITINADNFINNLNDGSKNVIKSLQSRIDDLSNEVLVNKERVKIYQADIENIKTSKLEMEVRLREAAQIYNKSLSLTDLMNRERIRWETKNDILQKELILSRKEHIDYSTFIDTLITMLKDISLKTKNKINELVPNDDRADMGIDLLISNSLYAELNETPTSNVEIINKPLKNTDLNMTKDVSQEISKSQQLSTKLNSIKNGIKDKFKDLLTLLNMIEELNTTIDLQHERLESLMLEFDDNNQQVIKTDNYQSKKVDSTILYNFPEASGRRQSITSQGMYSKPTNSAKLKDNKNIDYIPPTSDDLIGENKGLITDILMVDREIQTDNPLQFISLETIKTQLTASNRIYPLKNLKVETKTYGSNINKVDYQNNNINIINQNSTFNNKNEYEIQFNQKLNNVQHLINSSMINKIMNGVLDISHEELCSRYSKIVTEKMDNERLIGILNQTLHQTQKESKLLRKLLVNVGAFGSSLNLSLTSSDTPHMPNPLQIDYENLSQLTKDRSHELQDLRHKLDVYHRIFDIIYESLQMA